MKKEFGFYPKPLQVTVGPVTIGPLAGLEQTVSDMLASDGIEDDWIYAPLQRVRHSSRVFGLPKTHFIEHTSATSEDHLRFHIWALSFFLGMRLTTEEAGFLDATPLGPGKLKRFDFILPDSGHTRAVELADEFWRKNLTDPKRARRFEAAVHALLLAENPLNLQFERFVYLYTAIDTCYALAKALRPSATASNSHQERVKWLCGQFGLTMPSWADPAGLHGAEVAKLRNDTLHEALFMDAPLGFAIHPGSANTPNLILEMTALVCRLLVALIGGHDPYYLPSSVNTRQPHLLRLT